MVHDESRPTLSAYEQPGPLQKHADPETNLRQERDVNESPGEPRDKPMQPDSAALQNRVAFPNNRHVSFVEISKRFGTVFAGDLPTNQFAYVASLLHRNLSDTRQRLSILVERRGVADHENFRMIWNSKVWLNAHPAGAIHFSLYPFSRRRRRNTGGPDHCLARDSLTGNDHSFVVDLFNSMAQVNLDAKLLQMFFRDFRERRS